MRKKVIVGNWKMNNTLSEAMDFIKVLKSGLEDVSEVDMAVCPTYICINDVKKELKDSNIKVGAQNVYFEDKGAYTGEVSVDMLCDINVDYCIIGHSERRQYFNEKDEFVNNKLKKLLEKDIIPIVCVGENLSERERNVHYDLIKNQVIQAFKDIHEKQATSVIIAYEPIWAIGTGVTATPDEAEEMCAYIRNVVKEIYNENVSENIRIQYGGSVNITNSNKLLTMPNIDGALIGGASLKVEFVDIIKSVM